jgi:hypothetical protein
MKCFICKHGEMEQGFTTVTLEKTVRLSSLNMFLRMYAITAARNMSRIK